MSLWSKIAGFVGKIAPVLSFIPGLGPIAAAVGKISSVAAAVGAAVGRAPPQRVLPGAGRVGPPAPPRARGFAPGRGLLPPRRARRFIPPPTRATAGRPQMPQLSTIRTMNMSMFGAAGALARQVPAVIRSAGRAIGGTRGALGIAGGAAAGFQFGGVPDELGRCPVGFHLNKQDGVGGPAMSYCVRNRRMNVGNARAARRSVRRLKGAHKLLKDIEKMMPARRAQRRALPAPHLPAPHTH